MFQALYSYFYGILNNGITDNALFNTLNSRSDFFTTTIAVKEYLSFMGALVSLVIIVILCCLFVYKIIKLIGGLIR